MHFVYRRHEVLNLRVIGIGQKRILLMEEEAAARRENVHAFSHIIDAVLLRSEFRVI